MREEQTMIALPNDASSLFPSNSLPEFSCILVFPQSLNRWYFYVNIICYACAKGLAICSFYFLPRACIHAQKWTRKRNEKKKNLFCKLICKSISWCFLISFRFTCKFTILLWWVLNAHLKIFRNNTTFFML